MDPAEIERRLLYRDGLILVIDKPAGLPVHAGPGGGDTLERYFPHLRFGLPQPPALAHRLDRDTSGCLVLGRHRKALARLGRLFAQGLVEKTYWAVVEGAPPQESGTIAAPLKKVSSKSGGWRMIVPEDANDPEAKPAITDYRLLGRAPDGARSWLELRPRTGRTHQLRVHLAQLGCPILGEPLYRRANAPLPAAPLHLHARSLRLPLYPRKEPIFVQAEPEAAMAETIATMTTPSMG